MTELLPPGTSTWPASFTAGLHAALRRRIPPQVDGPALEELSRDLVTALEHGELTVELTVVPTELTVELTDLSLEVQPEAHDPLPLPRVRVRVRVRVSLI